MNQPHDDLPSEPLHTDTPAPLNQTQTTIIQQEPQKANAPARPMITDANGYESNPFSITFQNFTKMFKHAKVVAILMIVFGTSGYLGNITSFNLQELENIQNTESSLIEKADASAETVTQNSTLEDTLRSGASETLTLEQSSSSSTSEINATAVGIIILLVVVIGLVLVGVGLAVGAIWSGVVAASANMAVRDRDIAFGAAFSQSISRFGTMFVALFIAWLKTLGGYLLFIFPGIRAQARYAALPYVVMGNPSMSASQAVNETKKLYDGHLLESYSITFIGGIVPFIGSILSAVGLAHSARQISDYKSKGFPKPPMSGWNWVAPIVSIVITALMFIVLFLVVAALLSLL